jgi:hypothetical protein
MSKLQKYHVKTITFSCSWNYLAWLKLSLTMLLFDRRYSDLSDVLHGVSNNTYNFFEALTRTWP